MSDDQTLMQSMPASREFVLPEERKMYRGFQMPVFKTTEQEMRYKAAIDERDNFSSKAARQLPRQVEDYIKAPLRGFGRSAKEAGQEMFKEAAPLPGMAKGVGEFAVDAALTVPRAKAAMYTDPEGSKEFMGAVASGDREAVRKFATGASESMVEPFATGGDAILSLDALERGDSVEAGMYGAAVLAPYFSLGFVKSIKSGLMSSGRAAEKTRDSMKLLEDRYEGGRITEDEMFKEAERIEKQHRLNKTQPDSGPSMQDILGYNASQVDPSTLTASQKSQLSNRFDGLKKEIQFLSDEFPGPVSNQSYERNLRIELGEERDQIRKILGGKPPGGERKSAFEPFPEYVPSPTGITSDSTKRKIEDAVSKINEGSERVGRKPPGGGSDPELGFGASEVPGETAAREYYENQPRPKDADYRDPTDAELREMFEQQPHMFGRKTPGGSDPEDLMMQRRQDVYEGITTDMRGTPRVEPPSGGSVGGFKADQAARQEYFRSQGLGRYEPELSSPKFGLSNQGHHNVVEDLGPLLPEDRDLLEQFSGKYNLSETELRQLRDEYVAYGYDDFPSRSQRGFREIDIPDSLPIPSLKPVKQKYYLLDPRTDKPIRTKSGKLKEFNSPDEADEYADEVLDDITLGIRDLDGNIPDGWR